MLTSLALRSWETASLLSFVYTAIVAGVLPGLRASTRVRVAGGCAAGLALIAVSVLAPPNVLLHGWLLPPMLLLLAYWISGLLFIAPMPRAERLLDDIDRAVHTRSLASTTPGWLAEFLEFSYAAVYLLIPLALLLQLRFAATPDSDRFWLVILATDYVCFAALPWVQTRPPRALEAGEPWQSSFRAVNLRLLGAASIRVNTFPSGHAAEALAAALLVSGLPFGLFAWMLFNALAVSAGAVLGRYHYATDAFAGWIVAVCVWLVLR